MARTTQTNFSADVLHTGSYLIQLNGPIAFGALPRSVTFDRYARGGEALIYVANGSVLGVGKSVCFTSEKSGFAFPMASIALVKKADDQQERIWPPRGVTRPQGKISRSSHS